MCAIAGIVGEVTDLKTVERMAAAMAHRGPDGVGGWTAPGVALAHRRLKVIDLTDAAAQPMSTIDGRFTITFNGEIYNFRELRDELGKNTFRSRSDTEVVLRSFEKWGLNAIERFQGMFAFAIWDRLNRTLFCARDRLGIKPFYHTTLNGQFAFSSEIKGLLAAGAEARADQSVIYKYLAFDCYDHSDQTFFAGIRSLPPGHVAQVRDGMMAAPVPFWRLEDEVANTEVPSDKRARQLQFMDRLLEATRAHLVSDVPIAIALSGGLDSSILAAALDRVHANPTEVESFSFVFDDARYSERPFIDSMAARLRRKAHFVTLTPERFAETAESLVYTQEQPHGGTPVAAYSAVHTAMRAHGFVVSMDGSGLDEMLAGYARFRPAFWCDLRDSGDDAALEREWAASGVTSIEARNDAQLMMDRASAGHLGLALDLTRSTRAECIATSLTQSQDSEPPSFPRPFRDHLRNAMFRELRFTKLPRSLRFADRLSMASSTELRPPFLDHRLIAYAFALPAEDRINLGVSKALLRDATAGFLPDEVRLAAKRPVQTPQREWFRGPLRSFLVETIDTPRFWQRGWIEERRGRAAMMAFMEGAGDNSFFLWQWANLELWSRRFLDGGS